MYLERAEDYDKKMTDRWKSDADGILVFVSVRYIRLNLFARQLEMYRLVSFLPQSPRLLESPFRTLGQTLKISPHSILQISTRYSRMSIGPASPSLPLRRFHPNSPQLLPPSGSIASGS
jgi:hypothetical protein